MTISIKTNTTSTLARLTLTLLAAGGVISTLVWAGPLNPPGGAVSSTYKTLTEVEPRIAINSTNTPGDADSLFKITQPGSYYLTGNITGVVGKHGIEIAASGVTLDLNGFELIGVASMGNYNGVYVSVNGLTNLTVKNGSIRNWGSSGIEFFSLAAVNARVHDIVASGNSMLGIHVSSQSEIANCIVRGTENGIYTGTNSTVRGCAVTGCTGNGVTVGIGSIVSNCTSQANGTGFYLAYGTVASNCAACSNTGDGFSAIGGCTVSNCTARANGEHGIYASNACTIVGNSCTNNGTSSISGAGVYANGADNRIEANNCIGADYGVYVIAAGNIIVKNTCSGNTTNWYVVPANALAPIVAAGTNAATVSGNSYTGSLGSTDPNANFTY